MVVKKSRHWRRRPKLHRVPFSGPGQISIMGRPNAESLPRTLRALRRDGVTTIVSTLTPREVDHYRLQDFWRVCKEAELDYYWWPISDNGTPHAEESQDLLASLEQRLQAGEHIAIHCRLALGRSPMIAAALLTQLGTPVADALAAVSQARGRSVPIQASQRAWLQRLVAEEE